MLYYRFHCSFTKEDRLAQRWVICDEPQGNSSSVGEGNGCIVCVSLLDDDGVVARHFVVYRQLSGIHDRLDQIDQVAQLEQEKTGR